MTMFCWCWATPQRIGHGQWSRIYVYGPYALAYWPLEASDRNRIDDSTCLPQNRHPQSARVLDSSYLRALRRHSIRSGSGDHRDCVCTSARNSTSGLCYLGLFSSHQKPKTFQDSSSHRILRHMHGALNINKNKN